MKDDAAGHTDRHRTEEGERKRRIKWRLLVCGQTEKVYVMRD